ncbi:hypothetical protein [Gloeothece verrucosa]|uniref:Uncharacterized protein n=1 Tax=Gloeothece verrucosa (strain PCC 7822) TaxID=497965 RepID=E0UEF1_GLOV7|nr:hypothetical protein [Gloeothece verrucosa]ADN15397.1 conserved hypothetical protein [Gloeothece verrucosa PCC 7822]
MKSEQTLYGLIWQGLKYFPQVLAKGSQRPPEVSGPAAAAFISGGFGCWVMMIVHHLADTSKARDEIVWKIGSWIPGSRNPSQLWGNIGSYTGKETIFLISWLASWFVLHYLWRNKNIKAKTLFFWMFLFFIAATVMSWHPLFPYLRLM